MNATIGRNSRVSELILVLMAASSLLIMFLLTKIDNIVHQDLYEFGLQFSDKWAIPYWTLTAIIFGIGWFTIIAAIALELYLFISRPRRKAKPRPREIAKSDARAENRKKSKSNPTQKRRIKQKQQ